MTSHPIPLRQPDARSHPSRLRAVAAVLLGLHVALFAHLTLFRFPNPNAPANFVPFRGMADDFRKGGGALVVNFFGNLGIFVPIGVLLPLAWPSGRPFSRVFLASLALSATVETLQFLSRRRVADVDDILLNTAGGLIGCLILLAFLRSVGPILTGRRRTRRDNGP